MPWLILGVIAVIIFGSLYPFSFNGAHPGLVTAFKQLTWARASRADQLRNVLMYVPLGFCLTLWMRPSFRKFWAVILSGVIGVLLSLSIEVSQVYVQRVPSFMDVALNMLGALLGAVVGLSWNTMSGWIKLPDNARTQSGDRNALLLVWLWIVWRLVDISLYISLARLKMALHPLLHLEISWFLVLRYLLLWLVVSLATLSYASRQRGNEALLIVIAVVVIGRILLVSPSFDSSELLALVLLLPALVAIHALRFLSATSIALLSMVTLYGIDQVLPVNLSQFHFSFDFFPFVDWITAGASLDLNALLRMLFLFAALIWLLKESALALRNAVIAVVTMVIGIEIFHLWQMGRSGSITRPAFALGVGLLMLAIERSRNNSKAA